MTATDIYLHCGRIPPDELLRMCALAEDLGFSGISIGDHVAYPAVMSSRYPYAASGTPSWDVSSPWLDPWVAAAAIAAVSSRLRIVSAVLVLPLRHPLIAAKAIASAAALAPGRIAVGVASGWMAEEFELVAQDFVSRGQRLDEAIDILRLAWSGEVTDFQGHHYQLASFSIAPVPKVPIPILIGGEGARVFGRVATRGDGWIAPMWSERPFADRMNELASSCAAIGRNAPLEVIASAVPCRSVEELRDLIDQGATSLRVFPWSPADLALASSAQHRREVLIEYQSRMLAPLRNFR